MIFISRVERANKHDGRDSFRFRNWPSTDRNLFLTVISIELTIVLLVAPAATAGAVCLDKMRGTLDHMLVTDLSQQ